MTDRSQDGTVMLIDSADVAKYAKLTGFSSGSGVSLDYSPSPKKTTGMTGFLA